MREEQLGGLKVRLTGGRDGQGGGEGPMVVLMHGFGAPGTDLLPLAGEIEAPAGTRFAFPEAPNLLPFDLGGGVGRAWWMIDVMRLQMAMMLGQERDLSAEVPEGLPAARALVEAMLVELVERFAVDRGKLVLGGFSQGAMLACDVTLRDRQPLAGLVLLSGTYLAADEWTPLMDQRAGLPVLQSHGRQDPLLPFSLAERLRDALAGAGLEVTWVPFDGGHGIGLEVLDQLSGFLADNLGGQPCRGGYSSPSSSR